jgi:hypothetical protein
VEVEVAPEEYETLDILELEKSQTENVYDTMSALSHEFQEVCFGLGLVYMCVHVYVCLHGCVRASMAACPSSAPCLLACPIPLSLYHARLVQRMALATTRRPLLLVLDGLDQVEDAELVASLRWLPSEVGSCAMYQGPCHLTCHSLSYSCPSMSRCSSRAKMASCSPSSAPKSCILAASWRCDGETLRRLGETGTMTDGCVQNCVA